MTDPTTGPDGEPFIHDTFPPGAQEVYTRVRSLLIERLGWDALQLDTRHGARRLNDICARVVAIGREAYLP